MPLLGLLPLPPQTASQTPVVVPDQARKLHEYDLLDSTFRIALDVPNRSLSGTVVHTLRTTKADATLVFDFPYKRMELGRDGAPSTLAVKINGKPIGNGQVMGAIVLGKDVLAILTKLPKDSLATVEISYTTKPEAGMYFVPADRAAPSSQPVVYTQGEMEDTHYWLPTYDYPDDKATTEAYYTVPTGWRALGNGRLLGVEKGAKAWTWHWKTDAPYSTYLTTMLAGPYSEVPDGAFKGKPVSIFVPQGLESWAKPSFGGTDRIIAIYSGLTGTDYPWAKYAQGVVPDFLYGGMENLSATTQTIGALFPPSAADTQDSYSLNAHELAHQWFGDLVTAQDWSHIWINEGWATFMPHFAIRAERGEDAYQFERVQTLIQAAQVGRYKGNRPMVWKDYDQPFDMFDEYAYPGGASRMFALMHMVGEARFWPATRDYLARYRYKNADTDGFFASFSQSLGMDLSAFKKQWFYTNGTPNVVVSRVAGGFELKQTIKGFTVDLETEIVAPDGTTERKTYTLPPNDPVIVKAPAGTLLLADPGRWLVGTIRYPSDLSVAEKERLIAATDNAGARSELTGVWFAGFSADVQNRIFAATTIAPLRERIVTTLKDPATLLAATEDRNPRVAQNAVGALGSRPKSDAAIARLRALYAGEDRDARASAFRSLLRLTDDAALAEAGWTLATTGGGDAYDETMKTTALNWWRAKDPARARAASLDALNHSTSIAVLTTAVSVLGAVKDEPGKTAAYDALVRGLGDAAINVRIASLGALAGYGDKAALPLLEAKTGSASFFERGAAQGAVARLKVAKG